MDHILAGLSMFIVLSFLLMFKSLRKPEDKFFNLVFGFLVMSLTSSAVHWGIISLLEKMS